MTFSCVLASADVIDFRTRSERQGGHAMTADGVTLLDPRPPKGARQRERPTSLRSIVAMVL